MSNASSSFGVSRDLPLPATATSWLTRRRWSPYAVGLGLGVLSWLAFAAADQPLGVSTAVSQTSGACLIPFVGQEQVTANAYWARHRPALDYGTLFLGGIFLGALVSALSSGDWKLERVPPVWRQRFGPGVARRMVAAFLGGALLLYGARMAGGCTSGHGISGSLQLALSSWTFFIVMFLAGLATAAVMFRSRRMVNA